MKYLRYWPVLVVALLLLWQRDCSMKAQGELKAEIKATQDRYAALEERGVVLDTVYRTDTLKLTVVRRHTDSILTVDTLFRADRVRQIVAKERLACDEVKLTCEDKQANLLSRIANVQTQLALEKKKRHGVFAQLEQKIIWAGIGFGAAKVLSR